MPTAIQEQKFGIISDLMGVSEDVPTIKMSSAFSPASSGTFLQYGMVRSMPGAAPTFLDDDGVKVQTPDTNPIIHFWRHISAQGIEYVFAYTKLNVYRWNDTTKAYETKWEGTECTLWDTVSINGHLISTNGVDKVLDWSEDSPGSDFAALGSDNGLTLGDGTFITTAKYLATCENYLWLFGTTEGGSSYPRRARWSTYADIDDFDETGTGDTGAKDFLEGSDIIKGSGKYTYGGGDILVVFKEKSTYPVWLVDGHEVWNITRSEGNVGLLATHSVCNDKDGNLYYVASDYTIRKFRSGIISQKIDKTIKGLCVTYQDYIEAAFIDKYNQIWWSIPSDAAATGNDKIVAYNLEYEIWHPYPFAYRAFGEWSQQTSYTIDGLDALSDTIDGLDARLAYIDFVEGMVGFPLELGSDYSGYSYNLHQSQTDMGNEVTRNFVLSTDLAEGQALPYFKRVSKVKCFVQSRSTEETLELFVKEDNEPSYNSIGEISLQGTASIIDVDLTPDLRAKHFLFKGETTTFFDFVAMFFDFSFDGEM